MSCWHAWLRIPSVAVTGVVWAAASAAQGGLRNGIVEGVVLGPLGEPMANVEVTAAMQARSTPAARTRTDGSGVFVLGGLARDTAWTVLAAAPGHTVAIAHAPANRADRRTLVELRMYRGLTVRGHVRDPHGAPVAGATVLGAKDAAAALLLAPEVVTAADGSFVLTGVACGANVLRVWAPGRGLLEHELFTTDDVAVELTMAHANATELVIEAIELSAAVRAAARVHVTAAHSRGLRVLPTPIAEPQLDVRGRAQLSGLPIAFWGAQLILPDRVLTPVARTQTEPRRPIMTFVETPLVRLHGTLRDATGRTLAERRLRCEARAALAPDYTERGVAVTDADGHWSMATTLCPGEPYRVQLDDDRYVLRATQPAATDRLAPDPSSSGYFVGTAEVWGRVELIAVPAAVVTAKLVDATGAPLRRIPAELQGERRQPWSWPTIATAISDEAGCLTFRGVLGDTDPLRIRVDAATASGMSEPFLLTGGQRRDVVVTCQAPGTVQGQCVDERGLACAGVLIGLASYDFDTRRRLDTDLRYTLSDRDGRFVFVGVAPGGHVVETRLSGDQRCAETAPFAVDAGAAAEVELRLRP